MSEAPCHGCRGTGTRYREGAKKVRAQHGGRGSYYPTVPYECTMCRGTGRLLVQGADGPWRIRLAADNTVNAMQLLDREPHSDQRDVEVVLRSEDWESSCCGSPDMTTRGGDGSPGSPCWTICRACGEPCDPVAVEFIRRSEAEALAEALGEALEFAAEGWAYASDYFVKKWRAKQHAGELEAKLAVYRSRHPKETP